MIYLKKIKDDIRKECSVIRDSISEVERNERSRNIIRVISSLVSYRHSDTILLYSPIRSEVDLMGLAQNALQSGKKVAFPKCNTENYTMQYYFINSINDLEAGAYKVNEPKDGLELFDVKNYRGTAICFIPGLAFDSFGYRLGYGKGYYDKFLRYFNGSKIGVSYSELVFPSLPKGRYDMHCDVLITEKGIKTVKSRK